MLSFFYISIYSLLMILWLFVFWNILNKVIFIFSIWQFLYLKTFEPLCWFCLLSFMGPYFTVSLLIFFSSLLWALIFPSALPVEVFWGLHWSGFLHGRTGTTRASVRHVWALSVLDQLNQITDLRALASVCVCCWIRGDAYSGYQRKGQPDCGCKFSGEILFRFQLQSKFNVQISRWAISFVSFFFLTFFYFFSNSRMMSGCFVVCS